MDWASTGASLRNIFARDKAQVQAAGWAFFAALRDPGAPMFAVGLIAARGNGRISGNLGICGHRAAYAGAQCATDNAQLG